jgi:hypothetical protein
LADFPLLGLNNSIILTMIFAMLVFCASATIFKSIDLNLDPVDIGYPVGWFANTIDLSSNNAGNISKYYH